jgi:hypothetical protein
VKRSRRIALPAAAPADDRSFDLGPLFAEPPAAEESVPAAQAGGNDDFAALRAVLEHCGCFRPAPPDPPWADPRPDLVGDRARWLLVLELAYRRDAADPEGVFGALFGVRCCGAAIEHLDDDWTLKPEGPPPRWRLARGEIPADEWAAIRARWLLPQRAALEEILLGRKA